MYAGECEEGTIASYPCFGKSNVENVGCHCFKGLKFFLLDAWDMPANFGHITFGWSQIMHLQNPPL